MFTLGNFTVKEIIMGLFSDFEDVPKYVLDELNNAQIEVSSDSVSITDKNNSVVKTIYRSKSARFTSTSAMLSPMVMNAASGSEMKVASATNALAMPKIDVFPARSVETEVAIPNAKDGSVRVIGLFNNGANDKALAKDVIATMTSGLDTENAKIKIPAAGEGLPDKYLVKYDRDVNSGYELVNSANTFPSAGKLLLSAAIVEPCSDKYRAAYILLPNFTVDPSVTIPFNADTTTIDYNGDANVDYCSCERTLYYIYFPDEDAVLTGECGENITPASVPSGSEGDNSQSGSQGGGKNTNP